MYYPKQFLSIILILFAPAFAPAQAVVRTANFIVHAPTPAVARQIGEAAERYRREKAQVWLGYEMPAWSAPCPLRVAVIPDSASRKSSGGGATSFSFGPNGVTERQIHIEGPLDRLLAAVLPHEITHTVFAHRFGRPVPRWADEGGAVLSEDEQEFRRHDAICRAYLNSGRAIPMRRLFGLTEYPPDVMTLYSQGCCISAFLVRTGGKPRFLDFVDHGARHGWDSACQRYSPYVTVEAMERAWLEYMQRTRPTWPGEPLPKPITFPAAAHESSTWQPAPVIPSGWGRWGPALCPSGI